MAPSHKKGRGGDRLSALPDNALQRVLSHLASGEAVRSSALSRRWRRVHEGVPVIDLVDPKTGDRCGISNQKVCFDHTVTSAIISKGAETPIRTFRLNAFHPPYGLFDQWIAIVATSGVEDLDVKLRYNESSRHTLCPYGLSRAASADFLFFFESTRKNVPYLYRRRSQKQFTRNSQTVAYNRAATHSHQNHPLPLKLTLALSYHSLPSSPSPKAGTPP
jgi:hypothetical protein